MIPSALRAATARAAGDSQNAGARPPAPSAASPLHLKPAVFPLIISRRAEAVPQADLGRRNPGLLLPQKANDLLFCESCLLHRPSFQGGLDLYLEEFQAVTLEGNSILSCGFCHGNGVAMERYRQTFDVWFEIQNALHPANYNMTCGTLARKSGVIK